MDIRVDGVFALITPPINHPSIGRAVRLPNEAQLFACDFDMGEPGFLGPFSFPLDVPDDLLAVA